MMNRNIFVLSVFMLVVLSGCFNARPYYSSSNLDWMDHKPESGAAIKFTVFLIGDAGEPSLDLLEPTFKLLGSQLDKADSNSAVIFLGDNIYFNGLPLKGDKQRNIAEKRIDEQLKILLGYKGKVFFIPGNHDWNKGKINGLNAVNRQEQYIENYLNKGNVFLPDNGCPGPVEIRLSDDLVLIVLDTQWWLNSSEKPYGETSECDVKNELEYLIQFRDKFNGNKDINKLVVAHHPLYSNGYHGGHFPLKHHIFPLTAKKKKLFIPFPIIGSLYPLYRKFLGSIQDIPHPKYQALKKGLLDVIDDYDNVIYASGHDHNLQYIMKNNNHFLVSGSGSKAGHVAKRHNASFTHAHKGFMKLNYYTNGEIFIDVWEPKNDGSSGTLIFRKKLKQSGLQDKQDHEHPEYPDYMDSTITVIPGEIYKASGLKMFFFGTHYRYAWICPVEVPFMDLNRVAGGLTPIQRGGGGQTKSLRLFYSMLYHFICHSCRELLCHIFPVMP